MNEGLAAIVLALFAIFCTPYGWIGLGVIGYTIYSIYELKNKRKNN